MKWSFNHKSRKAFLTAAICLALSQSVFAMPTGGQVMDGDVKGIVNGTVASGGTINVNSNALIDWTNFGIDKGETLNFKFGQDYLNVINHVIGSDMSRLLGTLNAKNGNVYLINPNGILVGGGARIDAGSLILSTLNATDDQLKSALKDGLTNLDLTSNAGSKGITIENGANIKVGPFLGLLGNKVQIADNVTISDAPYDKNETTLVVAAADKASLVLTGGGAEDIASVTTGKDNTVTIGKADFNINNNFTDSYFLGNAISMKGTNLNINSRDQENSSTALDIIAADSYKMGKDDAVSLTMNPANRIDLDDVEASADYMHVIGGQTAINQSDLTLTKTTDEVKEGTLMPYMKVAALNGKDVILNDLEDIPQNIANTDGAKLTIKDSHLTSNENIALWGGSVELTKADLKTLKETNEKDNNIDIDAFKSFDDKGVTTDSFNTVKVTGGSLESGGDISVQGSSIALDGVKDVKSTTDKPDKGIFLMAGKKFTFTDNDEYLENNTDANAISVKNTTMSTNKAMALIGGKVDVTDDSNLTAGDLEVVAGSSYKNEGNDIEGTDTTNLTVSNSTIHSNEDATLVGSNINLANTKIEVGTPTDHEYGSNGVIRIAAAKAVGLVDEDGKGFTVGSVDKTGNLTMNKVTLSAQGDVMAFGKTVKLQGSNLSTTNDQDLTINALNTYKRVDGTSDTWTATKDNTMDVTGTTLTNKGIIELSSGKLTMDNSNLTATGKEGAILVDARASYTDDDNGPYVNKAADGMDVSIKDSNFSGDNGVLVVGNTVTIDGQSSAKSANAKVFFAAGSQSEMTDTDIKGNGAPVNVGKDVKYDAKNTTFAPGMKTIETKPTTPTEPTEPTKPDQPTTPTEPTKPDKPVVTPDPKPAVDVEKNIEQGKQDMTKALADNQDNASAAVKQQAEKLSDSKMTDEEKAAQVKGYAEAIENSQASAEEKQALVKDTVKSFEPTQQSSLEAQNKQNEAAQNNNAQTVIPDVTVKNVAPAEHEGAAATVTVDGTVVNE
ncbi:filamentous hemagglutinin N-terminal domain-containing protein [uncultured Mitsuokella sp.]|uniref:two-partner secretion domain-containing protein n=1 Tax=uncultured Mitsuokella sp. TaxID=453120 RepID=UPI00266D82AC|nr:filamentous hemagglutinin N-terminal domain-containing protein [uncultured Mitsuokella sp.]